MNGGKKKALITGVTGQDASYLAEFLLSKSYKINALKSKLVRSPVKIPESVPDWSKPTLKTFSMVYFSMYNKLERKYFNIQVGDIIAIYIRRIRQRGDSGHILGI